MAPAAKPYGGALNWKAFSWPRVASQVVEHDAAVVLSLQHTGTWFAIEFLRQYPEAGPFNQLRDLMGAGGLLPRHVVHAHMYAGSNVHPNDANKFIDAEGVAALAQAGRVVVPLRDPMKALLTRHARHPMLDHRYIVEGFVTLAQQELPFTYLHVDCCSNCRADTLARVLEGVHWPQDDRHVATWAEHWKPQNTSHDTAEKQWYRDGAWTRLRRSLGPEIARLLDARKVLVPFLVQQGFKELPWWSL